MPDNQPQNNNLNSLRQPPEYVQDAMCSLESAEINGKIAEKYQREEKEIPLMVNVIARTILKEISLMDFPRALKGALNLDIETTKAMSLDIAIRRFLPLKQHLAGVEDLIRKLGGEVPSYVPLSGASADAKASVDKSEGRPSFAPPPPPPPPSFLRKDLRTALKDKKETEEQLITSHPIKIEGFDGLVRPSLKNWLSDYIRREGVGPHSLITLTNYLYNSVNGKTLNPKEKKILGKILQSYDENTRLPISEKTGLIVLEEIEQETTNASSAPPTPLTPQSLSAAVAEQPRQQHPEQHPLPPIPPAAGQNRYYSEHYLEPLAANENPIEKPLADQISPLAQSSLRPPAPKTAGFKTSSFSTPVLPPVPSQNQSADWRVPPAGPENRPPQAVRQRDYLEPVDDLESVKPPARPEPRLEGNIIDLKNFRES
ncbi:MAG: hypothetical protein HY813_00490 [Candidatus Portnoybacteria bacterium]|nr:hypothetical protein [Candidatus Portnoybacteria bacterium]